MSTPVASGPRKAQLSTQVGKRWSQWTGGRQAQPRRAGRMGTAGIPDGTPGRQRPSGLGWERERNSSKPPCETRPRVGNGGWRGGHGLLSGRGVSLRAHRGQSSSGGDTRRFSNLHGNRPTRDPSHRLPHLLQATSGCVPYCCLTNDYKPRGFQQGKRTLSQLWRSGVPSGCLWAKATVLGALLPRLEALGEGHLASPQPLPAALGS